MSSFLLRRYREESKGSKYFIMCGWPGFEYLFPYVDEYWSVKPELMYSLYGNSNGFVNDSGPLKSIIRNLNHFFEDVTYADEFCKLYDNGFLQSYLDRYKNFKRYLPTISSAAYLGGDFVRELSKKSGEKVFLIPSRFIEMWEKGETYLQKIPPDFWQHTVSRLADEGYVPIVVKSPIAHDISGSKHVVLNSSDVRTWMAAMRFSGCTIDFFNGSSRFSAIARTPFVAIDQRARYNQSKEYEFEDLLGWNFLPGDHIYSFSTIITSGDSKTWNQNVLDLLIRKLGDLFRSINREKLPSTGESYEIVPYAIVRKRRVKKFGTRFIKVPKI